MKISTFECEQHTLFCVRTPVQRTVMHLHGSRLESLNNSPPPYVHVYTVQTLYFHETGLDHKVQPWTTFFLSVANSNILFDTRWHCEWGQTLVRSSQQPKIHKLCLFKDSLWFLASHSETVIWLPHWSWPMYITIRAGVGFRCLLQFDLDGAVVFSMPGIERQHFSSQFLASLWGQLPKVLQL